MRLALLSLSAAVLASAPANAQPPADRAAQQRDREPQHQQRDDRGESRAPQIVPPELTDPRVADQIGRVAGVVARSMMDLPVGELEAAIEGRPATPADRRRRVRDNVADPYIDQRIAAEAAASGRTMQAATKAIASSLPAIMKSLEGARAEIERVVANIPDPTYPRR